MCISANPIPTLPLARLGVCDEQFQHPSEVHGQGHVNRVIFHALALGRSMGFKDYLPAIWAAAYLHDLYRRHDGYCELHGHWAAERMADHWEFFESAGVPSEHRLLVEDAVRFHSLPDHKAPDAVRDSIVYRVLKDADGLDRVRLGDADPRYFRLESTPYRLSFAQRLYNQTLDHSDDWMGVWEKGVLIYNPQLGVAQSAPAPWDPTESGPSRRDRRLAQAQFARDMTEFLDYPKGKPTVRKVPEMRPVTYLSPEALVAFKEARVFKSAWEIWEEVSLSWHHRFNDNPQDARAYIEARLFGERCRHLVSGVLDDSRITEAMRSMYGAARIVWKKSVLDCASFTLNDSQVNRFALPFSGDNLYKALYLLTCAQVDAGVLGNQARELLPGTAQLNFVELQFHRPLTLDDVASLEGA